RKMMSLAAQLAEKKKEPPPQQTPTPLEIVKANLGPRGEEVLQEALAQYPEQTKLIVEKLAELIKTGRINEPIDGGELYNLFRSLGLRVKLDTKMLYVKRGEAKDLRELFR
ncbi:MAG: double-stranded DNA-binding protein, partial [Candidatus Caldarchaeum sp.]|nr:double-stranded DNA-binding protein [Candidatus Caldarchaeum sp.]